MDKLENFIDSCYHYFHAYQDRQSTAATPSDRYWADLKIATYFTVIAPLLVGIAYGVATVASLISRISIPTGTISKTQEKTTEAGEQILGTNHRVSIYEGDLVNGVPEGKGTLRFADGKIYVGEFKAGKMHGTGRLTMPSGKLYYEGAFENGMKHGGGTIRTQSTVFYNGSFKYDKREGMGVAIIPVTKEGKKSYHIYKGEFNNDLMHGQGKLTGPDGAILFEGLFKNGEPTTNSPNTGFQSVGS